MAAALTITLEEAKRYRKRRAGLRDDAASWITHWREIAENLLPRASQFLVTDKTTAGAKRNDSINNGAATDALERGAAGLHSVLTSPAQEWMVLQTANPDLMQFYSTKRWCAETQERQYEVFNRSNLYKLLPQFYEDMLAFGTGALFVEDDPERIVHFYSLPIGSYYIALDGKLRPDTLYRDTMMTVAQIVDKFCRVPGQIEPDLTNVSQSVRRAWDDGERDRPIEVCHAVEPNPDARYDTPGAKNMPWRSVWFERSEESRVCLGKGGFPMFPAIIGRWKVRGGDTYGNSPGMKALGDVKALQKLDEAVLYALDQIIEPAVQIPGQLDQRSLDRTPGGENTVTASGAGARIEPLVVVPPAAIEHGNIQLLRLEQRVNRAFLADLVLNLTGEENQPQKTAEEVRARKQEILLQLGAPVGGINTDVLGPLVELVFQKMADAGALPPVPEEMQGAPLKVEFRSLIAQAQRALGMEGLGRFTTFALANVAQGADPSSLDVVDFDRANEQAAEMLGIPPDVVRDPEARAEIRQARDAAMQQEKLMQAAKPLSDAAGAVEKLGKTMPMDGSALKNVADAMQGAAA